MCTSSPSQRLLVTWWGREVSIWRINPQNPDAISPTPEESRKLVSRIAIKGAEDIASAAISEDGSLLAVSTLASVKAFHLRPTGDAADDRLRVRKLQLPANLDTLGARLVAFSPDSRWLSIVSPASELHVARLEQPTDARHVDFVPTAVELERAHRKPIKQTGLRSYEKTITRLAFSPDSALLVASDLAGYLDSWVLEGHFDETAAPTVTVKSSESASSSGQTDSDSDSDDDDEDIIFYAQHWAENRAASLLPKLDSAPLLLSFRPFATQPTEPVHGNPGVHATRNNPHAHSHALPNTKSPLFVITAHHQVYEFDVLAGRLTDWSRRNPASVLPTEFQGMKDRVMGAVWDVDATRCRAWLYGPNWLGMLDLSRNYDTPQPNDDAIEDGDNVESELQTPGKKRKRRESAKWNKLAEQRKKTKGASGAGDKVVSAERKGVPEEIRRIEDGTVVDGPRDTQSAAPDLDDDEEDDDDDDEDAIMDDVAVGPLKRSTDDEAMDVDGTASSPKDKRRKWWCTYRYRPILGMVPIGARSLSNSDESTEDSLQEAVLIERPLWDLPHLKELGKA